MSATGVDDVAIELPGAPPLLTVGLAKISFFLS
jgi:hypothetical protein